MRVVVTKTTYSEDTVIPYDPASEIWENEFWLARQNEQLETNQQRRQLAEKARYALQTGQPLQLLAIYADDQLIRDLIIAHIERHRAWFDTDKRLDEYLTSWLERHINSLEEEHRILSANGLLPTRTIYEVDDDLWATYQQHHEQRDRAHKELLDNLIPIR